MRRDQIGQAVEAKVVFWRMGRGHGRAEALLVVAAIDPARGEAVFVRWRVVVEQALRGVQDLTLMDPERLELGEHVLEIAARGLVRAAVLGRVDRIEFDLKLFVARREALVVDVRQNDQLVVPLQVLKGARGIGERRPFLHRAAIGYAVAPACRNAPFLRQAAINGREQVAIDLRRRLDLLRRFMARMRFQNFVARQRPRRFARQGLQGFDHARFPVDQRAVAIEGQDFEVSELHRRICVLLGQLG